MSLTLHGSGAMPRELLCHHCGRTERTPQQCPHCASADVARLGVGTERVESDLADMFSVPIHRLDADATKERGALDAVLDAFAQPGPQVLVGTQMVAKGHDFPDVELAIVVDADTALAIPDFRAEERAFSLVAQLAGRAGRQAHTAEHAKVLVQSWDVEAEFLRFAKEHDVDGFVAAELERRRAHLYPPYTRIVRLLLSSPDESTLSQWSRELRSALDRLQAGPVLGPAPLLRLQGRHRQQLVLKTTAVPQVASAVRSFLRRTERARTQADVRVLLDVDPQSLI